MGILARGLLLLLKVMFLINLDISMAIFVCQMVLGCGGFVYFQMNVVPIQREISIFVSLAIARFFHLLVCLRILEFLFY